MKTTCVRVVLPTDELVRVKCGAKMTAADLARAMRKHCDLHKNNGLDGGYGEDFHHNNNACDADPATETSLAWLFKGAPSGLTLVRMGSELPSGCLVANEVKEHDILEFHVVSPSWTSSLNLHQTFSQTMPGMHAHRRKAVEEVRPVVTALIPLWRAKQEQLSRSSLTAHVESVATIKANSPRIGIPLRNIDRIIRQKWFAQQRRKALRYFTRQNKIRCAPLQERRRSSASRRVMDRTLLRAGMQLMECLQLLQDGVRGLVFLLRDAALGNSTLAVDDVFSVVRKMVDTLIGTDANSRATTTRSTRAASEEINGDSLGCSQAVKKDLTRQLSRDIAGKNGGVAILLEGLVVAAEWGTFWRSQRKEYACLCDNHKLFFFSSRDHCADYVFELGREREGKSSEASRDLLKTSSPLSQIDLSKTDWVVRKSSTATDDSKLQLRHAFAFFEPSGSMRLALDVDTATAATTWARMISTEINRGRMFARLRDLNGIPTESQNQGHVDDTETQAVWMDKIIGCLAISGVQNVLKVPLHSLHAQMDQLNDTARVERIKSWTLSQALKDLQRDRVRINGVLRSSSSLEDTILALTQEILTYTRDMQGNQAPETGVTSTTTFCEAKEMAALRFARQVIVYSSRTHGGGDILDMLHLLFGNERFCICPDARSMEPIEIDILRGSYTGSTLSAQITIKMTYRVIPTDSIGEQTSTNGDNSGVITRRNGVQNGKIERIEHKIIGTYTQTLAYRYLETNDIEGSVQLEFCS